MSYLRIAVVGGALLVAGAALPGTASAASRAIVTQCSHLVAKMSKPGRHRHDLLVACELNGGVVPGTHPRASLASRPSH